MDGWIREVEREWMNNWNYKEFKVGVGGLMRVREEEVDGWKGGWMELTFSSPTSDAAIRCRFGCIFSPSFAAFLPFFCRPPPLLPTYQFFLLSSSHIALFPCFPLFLITSHPLDNPYLTLSVVNLLLTFSSGSLWLCMCDNLTRLCVCVCVLDRGRWFSPRELKDCLDPWGEFGSWDLLMAGQAWVTKLTSSPCLAPGPVG